MDTWKSRNANFMAAWRQVEIGRLALYSAVCRSFLSVSGAAPQVILISTKRRDPLLQG